MPSDAATSQCGLTEKYQPRLQFSYAFKTKPSHFPQLVFQAEIFSAASSLIRCEPISSSPSRNKLGGNYVVLPIKKKPTAQTTSQLFQCKTLKLPLTQTWHWMAVGTSLLYCWCAFYWSCICSSGSVALLWSFCTWATNAWQRKSPICCAVCTHVQKTKLHFLSTPVHSWSQDLCVERGRGKQHVIRKHMIAALGRWLLECVHMGNKFWLHNQA